MFLADMVTINRVVRQIVLFYTGEIMNQLALGKRIREERQKLNLTQEQLAEKLNVSTTYIGFVERGERSITLGKLAVLANILGVSVDFLLSDTVVTTRSAKEAFWLQILSSATEEEQELILEMAKLILNHSKKNKTSY